MNEKHQRDSGKREISVPFGYEDAAGCFRVFENRFRERGAYFLADLSKRCADDTELVELADQANPGQPYAIMFFGAVHSILLGNRDDPFASRFGIGGQLPIADDTTFVALKDFCHRRHDEISAIMKRRTVQFTQPGRASYVIPLIGHLLRKGAKEPLSLVEVGCSAGLLTVFDHYYYDFGPLGRLGDPANPHIRVMAFEGNKPPIPDHMPRISERFGIDLNPIDPSDPAERHWLEGLMAPEVVDDLSELRGALDVRARIALNTIKGDAMSVVPELLPKLKDTPLVLHSLCLYQWPAALQNKFHEMLLEASRDRTIYRLAADRVHNNPARPAHFDVKNMRGMEMFAVTYRDGKADWEYLASSDRSQVVKWMA